MSGARYLKGRSLFANAENLLMKGLSLSLSAQAVVDPYATFGFGRSGRSQIDIGKLPEHVAAQF